MKNNKILILLILLLQCICFASFAQCPPPGGNQDPPGTTPPYPDPIPSSDVDITSEAPVDPNEIIGFDGYNAPESTDTFRWVSATQTLAYTVYFENDADFATAAASKVTINVPLSPKLNYATLGIGSFGFGSHVFAVEGSPSSYQTRIDLRDSMGIYLDVVAGLDIVHNEVFWMFQSIDPATGMPPTAINMGFLPINDSLHSGEGFVTFSIKPQTNDCLTGDTITATASIVFDVNEAIATNTWLNTIDAVAPTSTLTITPNAAGDMLTATFAGEDDEGGCGVKQYKLYYSVNGSAYQLYDVYPAGSTAEIPVETGMEYEFFTLAEDNVGNCEPMKTEPEFTIGTNFVTLAVNAFPQEAGTVTGGGTYTVNDTAQLTATVAEGYHFVNWMSQGVPVSTQNPYSAVVSQNQTYTAYFERDAYTLQTLAAAGSAITVFDLNGNEVPSGSTILHSDRLIVRIDTSDCYVMESILLNGVAYIPGDTLTVTGNITLVTSTVNLSNTEFVEATACDSYRWNDSTYTVSGDYVRTFTNAAGCDSVVNLHLTVNHSTHNVYDTIVCGRYEWHGETYTMSDTYTYAYTNENDCASVDTLHLTVNPIYTMTETQTVCENELPIIWNGVQFTEADTKTVTLPTVDGCDSVVEMTLVVNPLYDVTEARTICAAALPYEWNGVTFNEAGSRTVTLQSTKSCDSVVTMILSVNTVYTVTDTKSICNDELPYEWNGVTFNEAGTETVTLTSTINCDSVVTMMLTVNMPTEGDTTAVVCGSFDWHGYTNLTASGDYIDVLTNAAGCDSTVTLHLTVNHGTHNVLDTTVCESFTWTDGTGETYTVSDTYTHAYTNENGCASVDTLHLTVNHGTHNVLDITVCESFTWADGTGETYTVSDTYTHAYINENGCASVDTLHLTVNYGTHNVLDTTVCESFTWADGTGETYTVSDTYTHAYTNENGCASVDTLHLTVNYGTHNVLDTTVCESFTWSDGTGEIYTVSDTYTHAYINENGCASVDTLHLTVNYGTHNVLDTTVCESFTWSDGTGETYTVSDTYTHAYTNENGCASVDTLHLTVNYGTHNVLDTTVCESFTWADGTGDTYTVSDTYTHAYINENGCASVDTLYLTVNHGTHNVLDTTVCESFTWTDGTGETYTLSDTYTHAYINENGCANVDTLHLTVNHGTHNVLDTTVCESFTWSDGTGETYTVSDTYTHAYTNENGCASVDTLHLTVNYGTHNVLDTTVCESFTWTDGTGETYIVSDTYTHAYTNENGCASVDTLHLTVNYGTHNVLDTTVCESFTWTDGTGETYIVSDTYTHAYINENGCASVDTLHLTVNYGTHNVLDTTVCESFTWSDGTGETYTVSDTYTHAYINEDGCASVDTLHLTVHYGTHNVLDTTVCESFTWSDGTGETYTVSDTYTHAYINENGCASVDTLHLMVNYGTHNVLDTTVCESFTWTDGTGETYTVSDTYTHAYFNENGCASVDTLYLTVNHGTHNVLDTTVCESFTWSDGTGEIYTVSDTYTHAYTNENGCASVDTLHLTVNYGTHNVLDTTVCESFTWTDGTGETYTVSDTYTHAYINENGCASVDTLYLTVNHGTHNVLDTTVCESFTWSDCTGETYTMSDTYTHAYINENGCASVDTLYLTVNYGTHNVIDTTVCESFTWSDGTGEIYTVSDTYTHAYTNENGCASVDTLYLTVNHGTHNVLDTTVCESFTWTDGTGETYTLSDTYTHAYTNENGCASVDTLHLTVNYGTHNVLDTTVCESFTWSDGTGEIYTVSDTYTHAYTNENGCASVDTLHLTVNYGTHNVLDTTVCESFTWAEGTGEIYTVSDTYTHAYTNENGCASVDTLHLTVNHGGYVEVAVDTCGTEYYWALADTTVNQSGAYHYYGTNANTCTDTTVLMLSLYQSVTTELSAQICEGEVYAQNGFNVSTAGDHYLNLQTAHGCDSTVVLHLTVGSEAVTYLAASICEGDSYQENGFEIFSPAAGIYEYSDTIGRVGTCDSIVVLTLTVNAATSGDTTAVVNSSFDWYGQHLTTSGDYTSTLTNVAGCDSVVTLHLTVNYSGTGDTTAIACDEFDWYEHMNLTQSGDYTHTFTNIAGGDSVVTLHLTVNHSVTEIVEATACGNYTWNDIVYTESGDYERTFTSANGCDSTVVLHLAVIDLPELSMIQGEPVICRNQYSMYFYDITNSDYNYYWYHNSQFLAGNVPSVVLYEENSGTHTLMMQVEDVLNGCYADTSMSILVQNALAPDTTVIMRKNNTNILICSEVSSEYGTVHYRWGYTNLFTHEETIMEGDYNYCMFDIGIDLESYLYWVETYIQYADGVGCANRTYYGHSIYTNIDDYEHNTIDARVVNNQLCLHVNAAAPDMIDVILYGINGQLLLTQHYGSTDQVNDILPFQYSNGLYLLIVRVGNQVYPVKLLKY